jgi:hypothetical protein
MQIHPEVSHILYRHPRAVTCAAASARSWIAGQAATDDRPEVGIALPT